MSRVSLAASAIVASRRGSGCVDDVTVRYNILLCFELNLHFFGCPASRMALGSMPLFEFFGI